jgi:hypothetical protein
MNKNGTERSFPPRSATLRHARTEKLDPSKLEIRPHAAAQPVVALIHQLFERRKKTESFRIR